MAKELLISISGKKRSGKDQVGLFINEILMENKKDLYERKAFGDPVKSVASYLTGIPIDEWQSEEDKLKELGPEWNTYDEHGLKIPMTRRLFMTKLGTDAIGNHVHQQAWINKIFFDYTQESRWMITDVRFKKELEAVKQRNGVVIRIIRPDKTDSKDNHKSEVDLDGYDKWDFVINNNTGLTELKEQVRLILFKLGLI